MSLSQDFEAFFNRMTGMMKALFALNPAEQGTSVEQVYRKMDISDATFSVWRKKNASARPCLRPREEENRKPQPATPPCRVSTAGSVRSI